MKNSSTNSANVTLLTRTDSATDPRTATRTLREILAAAADLTGKPMSGLTVLSASRDPYRLDTPAGHKKGKWLADSYAEVNPDGLRLHSRGLHYRFVGRVKLPNGKPDINDDKTWKWMSEQAVKCARFLGYLPWDALRDARNAAPQIFSEEWMPPAWKLTAGEVEVWLPDQLEPRLKIVGDFYRQPWQQVIIAEKQGVEDVLLPIARRYQASLALPGGELSDRMLYDLMAAAAKDSRPLAIHQLGDFDPAGYQMAVSTARTAQALRDSQFPDLDVRVHAVGLTLDQCKEWSLPSTPLKETELRADQWTDAMGWEQTELDAAVSLVPDQFASVVTESLSHYFDRSLAMRASEERQRLESVANARLAEQLGPETLAVIRYQAEAKLGELDGLVSQVNEALRFDLDRAVIDAPDELAAMIGTADITHVPLFDSREKWEAGTLKLIQRKAYVEGA